MKALLRHCNLHDHGRVAAKRWLSNFLQPKGGVVWHEATDAYFLNLGGSGQRSLLDLAIGCPEVGSEQPPL